MVNGQGEQDLCIFTCSGAPGVPLGGFQAALERLLSEPADASQLAFAYHWVKNSFFFKLICADDKVATSLQANRSGEHSASASIDVGSRRYTGGGNVEDRPQKKRKLQALIIGRKDI